MQCHWVKRIADLLTQTTETGPGMRILANICCYISQKLYLEMFAIGIHSRNVIGVIKQRWKIPPLWLVIIIKPRRSRSAAAYSHQTFPWTICRSVCLSVGRSVCPVHCGKTADRIRQQFGTIGRTGPRMRQVLGFANRFTGRGTFGGEFEPHHCNQWGLYGVRVRQCVN